MPLALNLHGGAHPTIAPQQRISPVLRSARVVRLGRIAPVLPVVRGHLRHDPYRRRAASAPSRFQQTPQPAREFDGLSGYARVKVAGILTNRYARYDHTVF